MLPFPLSDRLPAIAKETQPKSTVRHSDLFCYICGHRKKRPHPYACIRCRQIVSQRVLRMAGLRE